MNALEFTTQIEKGVIHLPKEYDLYDSLQARVIVLFDSPLPKEQTQADKLNNLFVQMKGKQMFRNIDSPRDWQKRLRDEWE